jgi:hypothetical protein
MELIKKCLGYAEKYEVHIMAYSANLSTHVKSHIVPTDDDIFYMTLNDVKYANLFGATTMRQKASVNAKVLRRLLPYLEKYNVRIGIEISPGQSDIHGSVMGPFWELFEEVKSLYIGYVPDWGIFSPTRAGFGGGGLDAPVRSTLSSLGNRPELVAYWDDAVKKGITVRQLSSDLEHMKLTDHEKAAVSILFRPETDVQRPVEELRQMLKYAVHCHGKFHKALPEQNGEDWKIPVGKILKIMLEEKYKGYVMIEYEGHDMFTTPAMDAIRLHLQKYKEYLGENLI